MGDGNILANRIARLGEAYVSVTSFNAEMAICEVLPLLIPNEPIIATSGSSVPLESLLFYPDRSFAAQYPDAVRYSVDGLTPTGTGIMYDLAQMELSPQLLQENVWKISTSCRVVGVRTTPDRNGQVHPTTVIRNEVHIAVEEENGTVEFEDIFFEKTGKHSTAVRYCSGKHVVFRRCRFVAEYCGANFSERSDLDSQVTAVHVTFERCTFHGGKYGLNSNGRVEILMLNCAISNCETGVLACNSRVIAKHCGFHRSKFGTQSCGMHANLELTNCTFINNKCGMSNASRATCLMDGCRIGSTSTGSCLQGVQVDGPKLSTTRIDNCVIYKCDTGVIIECGNADFVMTNSKIVSSWEYSVDVEVRFDAIGNVDFVRCEIRNYEIWSGMKCFVTIDGRAIPPKSMSAIKQRIGECIENVTLSRRRLLKRAGVGVVTCAGCGKVEPAGVRFKKCMACFNACYCSKACQVSIGVFCYVVVYVPFIVTLD